MSRTLTPGSAPDPTAQLASIRNAISFGLLVFLMGQALMMGAFIAGHYPAWSIGILFSIGGISVSLLSVNEALRRLENRIADNPRNDSSPREKSISQKNVLIEPSSYLPTLWGGLPDCGAVS